MTRTLFVVNASPLLSDNEAEAKVKPLQTQIDRDFMPHWHSRVEPVQVQFASIDDIPDLPPDCWPIFLNRHSTDPTGLGWHDDDPGQNIRTYSRVFVGDCMQLGLNWHTTLSHEALELILDPDIRRVYRMSNGRLAALEVADACEADDYAYDIDGFSASDFVLPAYFSAKLYPPYDLKGHLKGRCPALTPGGYMSVTDRNGEWQQITMDRGRLKGRRAAMTGHRRQMRACTPLDQLQIESDQEGRRAGPQPRRPM